MSEDFSLYTYVKSALPFSAPGAENADAVVLGIPFDGTQTGKTGSRLGPTSIRIASFDLELYDLETRVDLAGRPIYDAGDIDCVPGSPERTMERIADTAARLPCVPLWVILGGEHSITAPIVAARAPDLVVSFDAHPDLRNGYMGVKESHAGVMRRIHEHGIEVEVLGVRECSLEEHDYAAEHGIPLVAPEEISSYLPPKGKRTYLSIDLDVLENMNVGNPVPGGLTFRELCATIRTIMSETDVIGVDIVELCADTTESSSYAAAKLLYKILAYWYEKRG